MARARLSIDLDGRQELNEQAREQIRKRINAGQWRPGYRLPTVREIALELNLNANAVSRLCRELTADGYLMRRDGLGTYSIDLQAEAGLNPETKTLLEQQ